MKKSLKEAEIYLVTGTACFKVEEGRISVVGAELLPGKEVTVPSGKKVPLEVLEDSSIDYMTQGEGGLQPLPERTIPETWDELVERLSSSGIRIVLVLGEVDTGKTFFSTYISNRLTARHRRVAVLDGDTGQSDIGPPGTLGLAVLKEGVPFLSEIPPEALYFTGSHSPSVHFLPSLVGVKRLVDRGLSLADMVIIDTPGWVQGDGGRALRRSEIEMLSPDMIILLQRQGELEHLVKNYSREKVVRIHVSMKASSTSPGVRKSLRELLSQKYFQKAREMVLPFSDFETDRVYWKTGTEISTECPHCLWVERLSGWEGALVVGQQRLSHEEIKRLKEEIKVSRIKEIVKGKERGVVVGLLNQESDVQGLGIIEEIDFKERNLRLLTPVTNRERIRIVQFGSLKLSPEGQEMGFIEPGYF